MRQNVLGFLQKQFFFDRVCFFTKVVEDAILEEYEQFDDYLEMTVQFGVSFAANIPASFYFDNISVYIILNGQASLEIS